MQGAMDESAPQKSVADKLKDIYNDRKTPSEFVTFGELALPKTLDQETTDKIKKNAYTFAFYHLLIFAALNFLLILMKKAVLLPIVITLAGAYVSQHQFTVHGHTIQPFHVLIVCAAIHLFLFCFITRFTNVYVLFIALNAVISLIVIFHSIFVKTNLETEI
ncbi:hypothetical protein ENBRE01_1055 [Enteropsectra breve]|nr:hypothetical protein ENBRE01_1055 [Enteropsectra breve]